MTRTCHTVPGFQLRLVADRDVVLGPGKADLLEAIEHTGSISSASRALGMSYRKAWQLIDTMNRHFPSPLVTTTTGGTRRGGARLTCLGCEILRHYRGLQATLDPERNDDANALLALLESLSPDSG